jgi:hypothetical protein
MSGAAEFAGTAQRISFSMDAETFVSLDHFAFHCIALPPVSRAAHRSPTATATRVLSNLNRIKGSLDGVELLLHVF